MLVIRRKASCPRTRSDGRIRSVPGSAAGRQLPDATPSPRGCRSVATSVATVVCGRSASSRASCGRSTIGSCGLPATRPNKGHSWERHGGSRNARANSPDGKLAPSAARRTSKSSGRSPTNRKSPTLKLSRPTRFLRGELTLGTNRLTRKELQEQRRRLRRQGVTVKPNTAPRGKPRQRGQNRTNDFT
ncbi:MAG: hypothetical protein RLY47_513 [Candidatus Parcubacteria bacterium]